METKQNYLMIGSFVLAGIALIFIFALWISGGRDKDQLQTYRIYFTESVNGLNVGSAVKYRGVEVGKVNHIDLDPNNSARVEVTADLDRDAPIKKDTIAMLKLQGITGLVYIELSGGSKNSAPLLDAKADSDEPPIIPSRESQLSQIVTSLPEIAEKFARISDQILLLLNDKNIGAMSKTIENMQHSTQELAALTKQVGEAITHVNGTVQDIEAITRNSRADAEAAVKQANKAMEELTRLLTRTNQFSDSGYNDLSNLLVEMKKTARDFQSLTREIKNEPSSVITPVQSRGVKVP